MRQTTVVAIICITVLSVAAIICGFNGAFLAAALAAISGLGGYEIRKTNSNKGGT